MSRLCRGGSRSAWCVHCNARIGSSCVGQKPCRSHVRPRDTDLAASGIPPTKKSVGGQVWMCRESGVARMDSGDMRNKKTSRQERRQPSAGAAADNSACPKLWQYVLYGCAAPKGKLEEHQGPGQVCRGVSLRVAVGCLRGYYRGGTASPPQSTLQPASGAMEEGWMWGWFQGVGPLQAGL